MLSSSGSRGRALLDDVDRVAAHRRMMAQRDRHVPAQQQLGVALVRDVGTAPAEKHAASPCPRLCPSRRRPQAGCVDGAGLVPRRLRPDPGALRTLQSCGQDGRATVTRVRSTDRRCGPGRQATATTATSRAVASAAAAASGARRRSSLRAPRRVRSRSSGPARRSAAELPRKASSARPAASGSQARQRELRRWRDGGATICSAAERADGGEDGGRCADRAVRCTAQRSGERVAAGAGQQHQRQGRRRVRARRTAARRRAPSSRRSPRMCGKSACRVSAVMVRHHSPACDARRDRGAALEPDARRRRADR